jgi:hypothetical protein
VALKIINETGKMILEYLSITFTSLILGMDALKADAPRRNVCNTRGRRGREPPPPGLTESAEPR